MGEFMGTAVANISSPSLGSLTPPSIKPHEKPITKKTKDVAANSLKDGEKKETPKQFCARIWGKFCEFVKKVFACLKNFFSFCCKKEESSSEYSSSSDLFDPLDEVEDFFLEVYKGKIPPDVDFKLKELGLKKATAKEVQYRDEQFEQLQAEAQEIAVLLGPKKAAFKFTAQGQRNLGNTCYMNSVLQCLEASYQKECFPLTSQDISLQKGETLEELEDRLLKAWAPIPKTSESLKTELSFKLLDKKAKGVSKFNEEVISLQRDLRNREDRILFKWSYLLLLQAKLKGSPEDSYKALKFHHKVCFDLALHWEFKEGPYQQKDAPSYFDYWNDMLGVVNCPIAMQRVSYYQDKVICLGIKVDPEPLIQIQMDKAEDLLHFIGNKFLEKKRKGNIEVCKFELQDKEIITTIYNVISKISSRPPKILAFQFKRFYYEKGTNIRRKIDAALPINLKRDLKSLDFSPIFRKSALCEIKPLYKLKCFVVHAYGNLDGGHYVAYVKRKGKWDYCEDNKTITPVDERNLPFEDAYMAFFKLTSK